MRRTVQDKLSRVRPPHTTITYDVEVGDSIEKVELPFVVGVLADLAGTQTNKLSPLTERNFISIDQTNFERVIAAIQPRLNYKLDLQEENQWLPNKTLNVDLLFNSIDDFYPVRIVERVESLDVVYRLRCYLRDLLARMDGNDSLIDLTNKILTDSIMQHTLTTTYIGKTESEWSDIKLDPVGEKLIAYGALIYDQSQLPKAKKMIGAFVTAVLNPWITTKPTNHPADCVTLINSRINSIDSELSKALSLIMHHPEFQRLEGTWRGLAYLVNNTKTGDHLKIKVLNVSQSELLSDMANEQGIHESALHSLLYDGTNGIEGSEPYSVLIGDYEIGKSPLDFTFLRLISQIAKRVNTPFITNIYAKSFDQADMVNSQKLGDLSAIFDKTELMYWQNFQDFDFAHFVTLTLPRIMIRLPYSPQDNPVEEFSFVEEIESTENGNFVWSGSAFALAQRIANAYDLYHWTAAIQGVEDGGLVEGLPVYKFINDDNEKILISATQFVVKAASLDAIDGLGIMTICQQDDIDKFAFVNSKDLKANKQHSLKGDPSSLPYLLTACRFAHYIKLIMRDKFGSFMTAGNIEDYLNDWISQYVLLDDSATQVVAAAYPLRGAKVQVSDLPGRPGSFQTILYIKPHFQLKELSDSIRMKIYFGT